MEVYSPSKPKYFLKRGFIYEKHTYWTVKTFVNGLGEIDYYYHSYENAKRESEKDYRDRPVKHTVNSNTYARLCYSVVFEDEEV